jgi:hypothetical protein
MSQSRINPSIKYPEIKNILEEDINHETDLYEMPFFGISAVFGLGMPKQIANIVYYPIYLVHESKCQSQIGVFEVLYNNLSTLYNEDGDIDISLLDEPLLYPSITRRTIQNATRSDKLCEQSALMAKAERNTYRKEKGEHWVNTFLSNPYYESLGEFSRWGEALFYAFDQRLTLLQIRTLLSEQIDEDEYTTMALQSQMAMQDNEQLTNDLKRFVKEHDALKERLHNTDDRTKQLEIVKLAETISKKHKRAVAERKMANKVPRVDSLDQLVSSVCDGSHKGYAALVERAFKINLILLNKDAQSVHCNGDPDVNRFMMISLERKGEIISPITYKGYVLFEFNCIPYDVKMQLAQRCVEHLGGDIVRNHSMRRFMKERHMSVAALRLHEADSSLYHRGNVFRICDSGDIAAGELCGEIGGGRTFVGLSLISDWRRKLGDGWIAPFEVDGHRWASVEHYVHGAKFKKTNAGIWSVYSMDSNSALSTNVPLAISKAKEYGRDVDAEYYQGAHTVEREKALQSKFAQHDDLAELLRETQRAILLRHVAGASPVPDTSLMKIRHVLSRSI